MHLQVQYSVELWSLGIDPSQDWQGVHRSLVIQYKVFRKLSYTQTAKSFEKVPMRTHSTTTIDFTYNYANKKILFCFFRKLSSFYHSVKHTQKLFFSQPGKFKLSLNSLYTDEFRVFGHQLPCKLISNTSYFLAIFHLSAHIFNPHSIKLQRCKGIVYVVNLVKRL